MRNCNQFKSLRDRQFEIAHFACKFRYMSHEYCLWWVIVMVSPTEKMRKAWAAYECQSGKMVVISFGPDKIRVAPETTDAWKALEYVLIHYEYDIRIEDTDSYNCRDIKSGKGKSLHSYGIALDVNWNTNPYLDHAGSRQPKFSSGATQSDRAQDVKLGKADTDMTREMVDAVLAIKTRNADRVFAWGGDWLTLKDSMHFQIELTPAQLAAGIDWNSVKGAYSAEAPSGGAGTKIEHQQETGGGGNNTMGLPAAFFDKVRHSVFNGSLNQSAVDNMTLIVDFWLRHYTLNPLNQLAYVLATVRAEVGANMRPVRETFAANDAQARARLAHKAYGRSAGPYGHAYYGRGYVQLTWLANYRTQSDKLGIDLVQFPDKALDPSVAIQVLVNGMMDGNFNGQGHGLGHYVNSTREDFVGARRTVNVQDRAQEIAGYARAFSAALIAANLQIQTIMPQEDVAGGEQVPSPSNPFPDPEGGPDGGDIPVPGGKTETGPVYVPSYTDPGIAAILSIFSKAIDENGKLDPAKLADIFKMIVPQTKELTPINAMLGDTVGNVLNGRKTAIGVIGSLLVSLLGGTNGEPTTLAQNAGSVLGPLLQTVGSTSQVTLPILAATTLWGLLGKIDKWVRLKK